MALATVPRYTPDRLDTREAHAVVVGGSMAGLLAARVLADRFERVTVIEKDPLPAEPTVRAGTPHTRHAHVLHEAGRATIEDLFPGYCEDLISGGALIVDLTRDLKLYDEGAFLAKGAARLPMYTASRALFEHITRERVRTYDGVSIRGECRLVTYLTDGRESPVEGVLVRNEHGNLEEIVAELVVDSTGRASRTPAWLADHGYRSPDTDRVQVDLVYGTVLLERPDTDRRGFNVMPNPPRTRVGGVFPVENGRWLMTLGGVHGDHPPANMEDFVEFAASLPIPDFRHLLEDYPVVSAEIPRYPFPCNLRRRYEELERFPDGLVVVGDAIASFNPVYGQGMSVAALEALQLHHTLAADGCDDVALRFFERTQRVVEDAWRLAVSADFQFPQTTGPKPFGTALLNSYISRLTRKAHTDRRLAEAFVRVITMENHPRSLFRPDNAWRVLKPTGSPGPEGYPQLQRGSR